VIKRSSILFFFVTILFLSACSEKAATGVLDTQTAAIDQWEITILNREITTDLSGTQSVVQYGGDSQDIAFNEKPADGYVFVLLDLTIEKTATRQSKFVWANAYLTDGEGNKFYRHENDTFLTNFNLPRIKSTDLVFGSHQGFVCYEVPQGGIEGELFFVYSGETGNQIEIQVN
jgi:hypothetical protein